MRTTDQRLADDASSISEDSQSEHEAGRRLFDAAFGDKPPVAIANLGLPNLEVSIPLMGNDTKADANNLTPIGDGWFRPQGMPAGLYNGAFSVSVEVNGHADLVKVQAALLPKLAEATKPGGPLHGKLLDVATQDPIQAENLKGNIGFLLRPADAIAAREVQRFVDKTLSEAGLANDTGKSAAIGDRAKAGSGRVVVLQNQWEAARYNGADKHNPERTLVAGGAYLPGDMEKAAMEFMFRQVDAKAPGWESFSTRADLYQVDPLNDALSPRAIEAISKSGLDLEVWSDPYMRESLNEFMYEKIAQGAPGWENFKSLRDLYVVEPGNDRLLTPEALQALERAIGLDGRKTQILQPSSRTPEGNLVPGRLMLSTTGQRMVDGKVIMAEVKDSVVDTPTGKQYNGAAAMYRIGEVLSEQLKTDVGPLSVAVASETKNRVEVAPSKAPIDQRLLEASQDFVDRVKSLAPYTNKFASAETLQDIIDSFTRTHNLSSLRHLSTNIQFGNTNETSVSFNHHKTGQPLRKTENGFIDESGKPVKAREVIMTVHLPESKMNDPAALGKELYRVLVEHSAPRKLTPGEVSGINSWINGRAEFKSEAHPSTASDSKTGSFADIALPPQSAADAKNGSKRTLQIGDFRFDVPAGQSVEKRIGRALSRADVLVASNQVADLHTTVRVTATGEVFITDHNTKTGTFVDGKRIESGKEVKISPTSTVTIGDNIASIRLLNEPVAQKVPDKQEAQPQKPADKLKRNAQPDIELPAEPQKQAEPQDLRRNAVAEIQLPAPQKPAEKQDFKRDALPEIQIVENLPDAERLRARNPLMETSTAPNGDVPTYEFSLNQKDIPLKVGQEREVFPGGPIIGLDMEGLYLKEGKSAAEATTVNGRALAAEEHVRLRPADAVIVGRADATGTVTRERLLLLPAKLSEVPKNTATSPAAVEASRRYATEHEFRGRLPNGFKSVGADATFDDTGKVTSQLSRDVVIVDTVNDPILRDLIAHAKEKFGHLEPRERAKAINEFAKSLMSPQPMSENHLDASYIDWQRKFAGKEIYLGQYIKNGIGVCSQQALIAHVLFTELGLDSTLVRGNVSTRGGTKGHLNHAWTRVTLPPDATKGETAPQTVTYDPRWKLNGEPDSRMVRHTRGAVVKVIEGGRADVMINGRRLAVDGNPQIVGKAEVAAGSGSVSDNHVEFTRHASGELVIKDISANGTWVNGTKLTPGKLYAIKPTDKIHLGSIDGPTVELTMLPQNLSSAGKSIGLPTDRAITVGQRHTATIPLPDTNPKFKNVSADHLTIRRDAATGVTMIKDISEHGTWVNGQRLPRNYEVPLPNNAIINLGAADGPEVKLTSDAANVQIADVSSEQGKTESKWTPTDHSKKNANEIAAESLALAVEFNEGRKHSLRGKQSLDRHSDFFHTLSQSLANKQDSSLRRVDKLIKDFTGTLMEFRGDALLSRAQVVVDPDLAAGGKLTYEHKGKSITPVYRDANTVYTRSETGRLIPIPVAEVDVKMHISKASLDAANAKTAAGRNAFAEVSATVFHQLHQLDQLRTAEQRAKAEGVDLKNAGTPRGEVDRFLARELQSSTTSADYMQFRLNGNRLSAASQQPGAVAYDLKRASTDTGKADRVVTIQQADGRLRMFVIEKNPADGKRAQVGEIDPERIGEYMSESWANRLAALKEQITEAKKDKVKNKELIEKLEQERADVEKVMQRYAGDQQYQRKVNEAWAARMNAYRKGAGAGVTLLFLTTTALEVFHSGNN